MSSGRDGDAGGRNAAAETEPVDETASQALATSAKDGLATGTRIGRHVILTQLGQGGMGVVYAAYDPVLDRKIAIKLLRPGHGTADAGARLAREAQAMARLAHPNVVPVFDVGTHDDSVFVAMEFVDGVSLRDWVADTDPPWRAILDCYIQAGKGLAAAHAAGIVHRDFKPGNVMRGADGRIRVLDFGLARAVPEDAPDARPPTVAPGRPGTSAEETPVSLSSPLTQVGALVGTPAYMAPEQVDGRSVTTAADQFAFAVALWSQLYRTHPFGQGSIPVVLGRSARGELVEPPAKSKVPARVRQVLERALQPDPGARFPSVDALLAALELQPWHRRPQVLIAAGVVATAALVVAGVATLTMWRRGYCTGMEDRLVGVWDAEHRSAVRTAMLATKVPYAAGVLHSVEKSLDEYAAAWVAMREEACQATRIRGEQSEELLDLRVACLDRRLLEVAALVDLLGHPDPALVERAAQAAANLSGLEGCSNPVLLRSPLPPPRSEEAASAISDVERQLASGQARLAAGKFTEAREIARSALTAAEALGHPPLLAEALHLAGETEEQLGELESARQLLQRAVVAAEAGRAVGVKARSLSVLGRILGYRLADAKGAAWCVDQADAVLAAGLEDDSIRADLLNNRGLIHRRQGKYAEAVAELGKAVTVYRAVHGGSHVRVAQALNALGNALADAGQLARAEEELGRALELFQGALGPDHPNVAKVLNNLGTVARNQGHLDRATAYLRQALDINQRSLGATHPEVALVLYNLANVLESQKEHSQAAAHYRRALELDELRYGPDHPNVAEDLSGLATSLDSLGRYAEAKALLERAISITRRSLGPDDIRLSFYAFNLGDLLLDLGKTEDALVQFERAVAIAGKDPAHKRYLVDDLIQAADCLIALGRYDDAAARLARATTLLDAEGVGDSSRSQLLFGQARVNWAAGDKPKALELAGQARKIADDPEVAPDLLSEIDGWLAERVGSQPPARAAPADATGR